MQPTFRPHRKKRARNSGAFKATQKANDIIRGKKNLEGAIVLADKAEQVPEVKKRILERDAQDPKGALIEAVNTIWDYLPGPPEAQEAKTKTSWGW